MPKTSMSEWQWKIGAWQRDTFPDGTAAGCMKHLEKEVVELSTAMESWREEWNSPCAPSNETYRRGNAQRAIGEELADIQHLIMGIANRCGISLEDELAVKFALNKTREWGNPDASGVREHVRTPRETIAVNEVRG